MKLSAEASVLRGMLSVQIGNRPGAAIDLPELQQLAGTLAPIVGPSMSDAEVQAVIDLLMEQHNVLMEDSYGVVDKKTFEPWLQERRSRQEKNGTLPRSSAYGDLLLQRGWAGGVLDALDRQTDRIMDLAGDPEKAGPWKRRGIAIGEVQSGKTASYISLLAKAIDYGFKVLVVIGGHTEDLRRQTQGRLDSDLTGVDSSYLIDNISSNEVAQIGIGKINKHLPMSINVLTTTQADFNASSKRATKVALGAGTPTLFVVKKNKTVLNNLAQYLRVAMPTGHDQPPMLLIDDEADWASINTNDEANVTAVNAAIRKLLEQSNRNSYIGITATPFANIFINDEIDEDLFPKDYIQVLQSPSNYQGVSQYFSGTQTDTLIEDVSDTLAVLPYSHKMSARIRALPLTLRRAIIAFYLGTAARRLRDGDARPASMLVNVSRFKPVQAQVFTLITEYIAEVSDAITGSFAMPEGARVSDVAGFIRETFDELYPDIDATWMSVRTELVGVAEEIRARLVNGDTKAERDRWLLQTPRRVREADALVPTIYVGGDILARGLTLDGLQVSYYSRQAAAADTLLQMGRWFGYRPGYEDLVRLWIDPGTAKLFRWTSDLSQELRDSLAEMEAKELTPTQFGLKMRRHPEGFLIASARKMQHAQTFEGIISPNSKVWESHNLPNDGPALQSNRDAAAELFRRLSAGPNQPEDPTRLVWRDVPFDMVSDFLGQFRAHASDPMLGAAAGGASPLATGLSGIKASESWDVAFVQGSGKEVPIADDVRLYASQRNNLYTEGTELHFANRRVAAGGDLMNTLDEDAVRTLRDGQAKKAGAKTVSDHVVRNHLIRPVLMVYTVVGQPKDPGRQLQPGRDPYEAVPAEPVIAIVVSAPALTPEEEQAEIDEERGVRWVINGVYARHELGWSAESDAEGEEDW